MNNFFGKIHIISKYLAALVAAFLVSELLVRDVFLGYSPTVRPDLADRLVNRTIAFANLDTYINFFSEEDTPPGAINFEEFKQQIATLPRTQIVKGVYAVETDTGTLTEIQFEEIEWQSLEYRRKDGTRVTIRIPKGTSPPPPGAF
jgi:hypothetical protein